MAYDVSRLNTEIARFAGGGIKVSSVNGRILLSGMVADAVTLDKAVKIARQFVPDVINTVQVMQAAADHAGGSLHRSRRGRRAASSAFSGTCLAAAPSLNIGNQVPAQQLPITAAGGSSSSRPFEQRYRRSELDPQWRSGTPLSPAVAAGVLSGAAPFGFLVGQLVGGRKLARCVDQCARAERSRAQPGGTQSGGFVGRHRKLPCRRGVSVPGARRARRVSFDYQPYGVGLSFTPTVLRDGLINLVIKPEVSELDTSNTVTVAGTSVPPLIVRRASTTIELRDGQSFMLGGLLQNPATTAQDQLPWVGDTPVLGALFRSSQYQKNETDLVILVTPHIVRPLPPSAPIHTPLDSSLPANDIDFFLMGQAEVSPALARLAIGAMNRPFVGHILDLPRTGGVYVSARN